MQTGAQVEERRRCGRYGVQWPAEVRIGRNSTTGVVRDLGDGGAFVDLSSVHRWSNPRDVAQLVNIGDQFFIWYTLRPFTRSVRRLVTLCWIGRHPTQNCFGLGVKFEAEP